MQFNATTSAGEIVLYRMRAAGTDATGTNYGLAGEYVTPAGGVGNLGYTGRTSNYMPVLTGTGTNKYFTVDIMNPFEAKQTVVYGRGADCQAQASFSIIDISGLHDLSTSYDSMTLFVATGTMTGSVSVYGYNK
jgi:hypothetical protein